MSRQILLLVSEMHLPSSTSTLNELLVLFSPINRLLSLFLCNKVQELAIVSRLSERQAWREDRVSVRS